MEKEPKWSEDGNCPECGFPPEDWRVGTGLGNRIEKHAYLCSNPKCRHKYYCLNPPNQKN